MQTISLKESVSSVKTLENAAGALLDMMKTTQIGEDFQQGEEFGKLRKRESYEDLSLEALTYSLFLYGEKQESRFFRVSDLYGTDGFKSAPLEFGISKNELMKKLRTLSSDPERVIIAELNMGLDHITLKEGISSFDILQKIAE